MEPAHWGKARGSAAIRDSAVVIRNVKATDAAKAEAAIKAPSKAPGRESRKSGIKLKKRINKAIQTADSVLPQGCRLHIENRAYSERAFSTIFTS